MDTKLHLILVIFFCFLCKTNNLCKACKDDERQALLTFKQNLTDECNLLSNWNGSNCCKWRGVSCSNKTGHVIKLSIGPLTDGKSAGCSISIASLDQSLSTLKHLQRLDLSQLSFDMTATPQFIGLITSLTYLNLSNTNLHGRIPLSFGDLTKLQYLDLSNTEYDIFSNSDNLQWLFHLSSLKFLDMTRVNLTLAVDWSLVFNKLPSLSVLKLRGCNLPTFSLSSLHANNESSITMLNPWLGNFSSLKILDLSYNNIVGSLPKSFSNLLKLEFLDLSGNSLHGQIPGIFTNLCNLQTLLLSRNYFVGELSGMIEGQSKCKRYNLQEMDLSLNQLSGSLPDWIGQMRC